MSKQNIELPEIGEGVTEGELVQWLVKAGDAVEVDQPLAEVLTDKATVEIPSSVSGKVAELKANEGDVIEVGDTLLVLDTDGAKEASKKETSEKAEKKEDKQAAPTSGGNGAQKQEPMAAAAPAGSQGGAMETVSPPPAESRVLATPATRRFAREAGIDINAIEGTGAAGRVTLEDVKSFTGAGASKAGQPSFQTDMNFPTVSFASKEDERVPLRGIRRKIAEKMQMAKRVVPHFTIMDEANVTDLVKLRTGLKEQMKDTGIKVTFCHEGFNCHS